MWLRLRLGLATTLPIEISADGCKRVASSSDWRAAIFFCRSLISALRSLFALSELAKSFSLCCICTSASLRDRESSAIFDLSAKISSLSDAFSPPSSALGLVATPPLPFDPKI